MVVKHRNQPSKNTRQPLYSTHQRNDATRQLGVKPASAVTGQREVCRGEGLLANQLQNQAVNLTAHRLKQVEHKPGSIQSVNPDLVKEADRWIQPNLGRLNPSLLSSTAYS